MHVVVQYNIALTTSWLEPANGHIAWADSEGRGTEDLDPHEK